MIAGFAICRNVTMALKLYIGNKNYSSWSFRAWLALRGAGIAFEEVMVPLDFSPGSDFKQRIGTISPAGRVPVLVDDAGQPVWDTLAIVETIAERHPDAGLWPADPRARARARSICAEMHSGFGALRQACPMNIEAELGDWGAHLVRTDPALRADLARIEALWTDAIERSGGPLLFGRFSAADAFYAPVAWRIVGYGLPVGEVARRYIARLLALDAAREWEAAARREHHFLPEDEPYRERVGGELRQRPLP